MNAVHTYGQGAAATTVQRLRACALCVHKREVHAEPLHCAALNQPCQDAREPGNGCGPHANLLHMAAWGAVTEKPNDVQHPQFTSNEATRAVCTDGGRAATTQMFAKGDFQEDALKEGAL